MFMKVLSELNYGKNYTVRKLIFSNRLIDILYVLHANILRIICIASSMYYKYVVCCIC